MTFGLPLNAKSIHLQLMFTELDEFETQLSVFWSFAKQMKWVEQWYFDLCDDDGRDHGPHPGSDEEEEEEKT